MPLHSFLWMKIISYLALTTDMECSPQKHYASYQTCGHIGVGWQTTHIERTMNITCACL